MTFDLDTWHAGYLDIICIKMEVQGRRSKFKVMWENVPFLNMHARYEVTYIHCVQKIAPPNSWR